MKKRIKKSILVLGVAVMLLSSSLTAFAASCLSVRDYGCHKYNHRYLGEKVISQVVNGMEDGKLVVYVTKAVYGKCVCGKEGVSCIKAPERVLVDWR